MSRQVNEWVRNSEVAIITISPYSPSLNPAEFWIAAVKAKIRRLLEDGYSLTILKIKAIVDELKDMSYGGVLKASRKETSLRMKILIK